MKFSFTFFALFLLSQFSLAQSLKLNEAMSSQKNLEYEYLEGKIVIQDNGTIVNSAEYNLLSDDPSFKVYPLQNGEFIIRENIANFVLYDSFGAVIRPISNSSQSKDGESISELAMDPNGKTIVLYNPEIKNSKGLGSRAQVIGVEDSDRFIFYSNEREIRTVCVSENGQFVAIATGKEGTEDEVTVVDRFGNEVRKITFDREIVGLNLYGSGSTLTVFSSGRVAVYNVLNGKRIGSSSFRGGTLRFANYSGSDKTIIGLTGDLNDNTLSNIGVRIINVDARKIASQKYSGSVQVSDLDRIKLNRNGRFNYTIVGMSKNLNLKAEF